jgi:hypothetical protein
VDVIVERRVSRVTPKEEEGEKEMNLAQGTQGKVSLLFPEKEIGH